VQIVTLKNLYEYGHLNPERGFERQQDGPDQESGADCVESTTPGGGDRMASARQKRMEP
jgi:hypothetical protein